LQSSYWYWRRWPDSTVVVMASGPSMNAQDAETVREAGVKTITVNTTFKLAPWADAHYTNDDDWLALHIAEMRATAKGEIWTGHTAAALRHNVRSCAFDRNLMDLSLTPGVLGWGGNSGFAAINLAVQFGAHRIVLLGFDQQWQGNWPRWHGRHPDQLQNQRPGFARWAIAYKAMAVTAKAAGIHIVNASRETSLKCFPRMDLKDALCD